MTEALASQAPHVWGRSEARTRFEERHSVQPGSLTARDIDRWMDRSRSALRNLARADYEAARRDLTEAQDLTAGAIEELNRESKQARQLLDTCLYLARALFEAGERDRALLQVRACRARSPKASPSEGRHTPETLALMHEVDVELEKKPLGKLFIDSVPRGCTVRLNGFDYGPTPRVISGLMQGEYRVQVECGGADSESRGRLYRVTLGEAETRLTVDARFDAAVLSEPALSLRYGSPEDEEAERLPHARTVAEVLEASSLLLITEPSAQTLRIDRVDMASGAAQVSASVVLPAAEPLSAERAQQAVQALLAQASLDLRQDPAGTIAPWAPPQPTVEVSESSARPSEPAKRPAWRGRSIVGWSLIGVGAAGAVGAALVFRGHRDDGLRFRETVPTDDAYLDHQQTWLDSRRTPYALMAPSAALASAGAALVLGREAASPATGWSSGAVGVGLLAWGLSDIALGGGCNGASDQRSQCVVDQERRDRGGLITLSALPFLYVPVHQWVFGREENTTSVSFDVQTRTVSVQGVF